MDELSPRTELLDNFFHDLLGAFQQLVELEDAASRGGRSSADRERRTLRPSRSCATVPWELATTLDDLRALMPVIRGRQRAYQQARSELAEAQPAAGGVHRQALPQPRACRSPT